MAQKNNVLTEEFLFDLFATCFKYEQILSVVTQYIKPEYMPDRDFIAIHKYITEYYKENKSIPTIGSAIQALSVKRSAVQLLGEIRDEGIEMEPVSAIKQLEAFIRQVKFQKMYREAGELYNKSQAEEAEGLLIQYAQWADTFSLQDSEFTDIIETFGSRFKNNRAKHNEAKAQSLVNRFYIDELDERNGGRNLRGQLTCFLAATGVGKTHIARWVGKNACMIDGLNVLHFQLEGSKAEVEDAYSASLVSCNSFKYETGTIRDVEIQKMEEMLKAVSGKLFVKSYPKFNTHVSTVNIKNDIEKFKKQFGFKPDVVIIDSMDLLSDASGRKYGENGERHKRIAVANDLKDIAGDEDIWVVVTYQSTIENREWLNDEKNVLTEYNTAEAKGLSRPLTHLITLNQSDRERKEYTMRINIAKSRFFEKGEPFRIATNYEHEVFYDRERTMNLNKIAG